MNNTKIQNPSLQKIKKKTLQNISFMFFIDALSFGIVFPIMPQLLFNDHIGLILNYTTYRAYFYSLTIAIYPLTQFFGMSFFGIMSDKYGRTSILLVGLIALVSSYFLATLAILQHNFIFFLLCRAFSGFFGGIYSIGNAIASDISGTDEKERLSNFKLPSIAEKLGLTIGPTLSIFVVSNVYFSNEFIIPYLIISLLGCFNIFLLIYNLKSISNIPKAKEQEPSNSIKWIAFFNATLLALKKKNLRPLLIAFIFYQCGAGLFIQSLSFYLTVEYQYTPAKIGIFSGIMACILLSSTCGLTQLLSKKFSCNQQLKIMLFCLLSLFFYALVTQYTHGLLIHLPLVRFWYLSGLFYLTLPQIRLCFITLFSTHADESEQGSIMGAAGQITAFSYFVSGLSVAHVVLHHGTLHLSFALFLISFLLILRRTK